MNNYADYYNYINNLNPNMNKNMMSNMKNKMNNTPNQINNMKQKDFGYDTDPYTGFIRGNMFSGLYDPYKNYKPQELNPANEKESALFLVQMYDFAAHDLSLYLDTNPNDANAINLRNKYINMYKQALAEYESRYGALTQDSQMLETKPWAWNTKKWPWEGTR